MADEIQFKYRSLATTYFRVWSATSQIWNSSGGGAFENFDNTSYANYVNSATEKGNSAHYAGTFPPAILPGVYSVEALEQIISSPAQTDPIVAVGDFQWNGTASLPLSNLATSGQLSTIAPIKLARGCAVNNFPVYLRSSVDHSTPFTSGIVSGQIARDNGSFGPLQSGAFTETGLGFYNLLSLTSGDLLANTVKLVFTATGISGQVSDPLPMSFVLQKTSGQA